MKGSSAFWPTLMLLLACSAENGSGGGAARGQGSAAREVREAAREIPAEVAEDLPAVVRGNSQFGLDLYATLRPTEGNLFFSPFSLSTALAMTYAGAAGETAVEMAETLGLPPSLPRPHAAYGALLESLARGALTGAYRLEIANRLWGQSGYAFRETFLATCREHYGAGFRELDFRADPEACRTAINDWVEEATEKRIQDLIAQGGVSKQTRLVLTNAVYFKGDWDNPFRRDDTHDAPFYLADGESVQVPLMRQYGRFRFAERDGLKLLELPYQGEGLALLVVLPESPDGLPEVEAGLGLGRLQSWLAALRAESVEVFLPRFEIAHKLALNEALKSMGMESAFKKPRPGDPKAADFTGMAEERELFIDDVLHQAWVRVDEKGTEAAAASAVVMDVGSALVGNVFRADHPFLFFLRDTKTGSLLFMGRLAEPRGQAS